MRAFAGRSRIVSLVAVAATAFAGLVAVAANSQAVAPVQFVDGGMSAPAATLGGYSMTAFADPQPNGWTSSVDSPLGGSVALSTSLDHEQVAEWGSWSNGYTGDVYGADGASSVTLSLPAGTRAFYFYAEPAFTATYGASATTDNGTSSGTESTSGVGGARNFGFYTTDGSAIASITLSMSGAAGGLAIGEFGINQLAPTITVPTSTFHAGTTTNESATVTATTPGISTSLSCSCGTLPSGLHFVPISSGSTAIADVAGEAAAGTGGTYIVHMTATASGGASTTEPMTVTVLQAPSFGSSAATFTVGTAGSSTVPLDGFPAPTVTELGTLPAGLSFGAPNCAAAQFCGTPTGAGGQTTVSLTAANGFAETTESFTLTVDQAPAIALGYAYPVFSKVGTYFSYSYASFVSGYPAPTVTWSGTLPIGVSFGGACGYATLCGTPADHTGANWFGTLVASNGVGSNATRGVLLQVEEAPWFSGATSATFVAHHANTSGAVTTYGGYNPPSKLTTVGTLPSWLSFDAATGAFSGTPPVSASGYYGITVQACNGYYPAVASLAMCRTETFTIFVQAPHAPMPSKAPASDGLISGVDIITGSGSTVTWSGTGFAPYAPVTFAVYNAQTYKKQFTLATVDADANGDVTYTGTAGNSSGIKYVVAGGYRMNGSVRYLTGQTRYM